MYQLTDDQVDYILSDIEKRGIETEDLRLDLLDHVCCIIENEMVDKAPFIPYYEKTIGRFFREELRELEEETNKLKTFKHYYAMIRTLKLSGIFAAATILLGAIFKYLHLQGAPFLFIAGLVTFALIFLPLNILLKFKDDGPKTDKLIFAFGLFLTMTTSMGILFKIMWWPYANFLMFSSLIVFLCLFIPLYFFTRIRRPELKFNTMVGTILMIAGGSMLLALSNNGKGYSMENYMHSMDQFVTKSQDDLSNSNKRIYALVEKDNIELQEMYQLSNAIYGQLESIRVSIISEVHQVSAEQAAQYSLAQMRYVFDKKAVKRWKNKSEFKGLLSSLDTYNGQLKSKEKELNLGKIQFDPLNEGSANLPAFLHALVSMQWQLTNNDNLMLSDAIAQGS